MRHTTRRNFLSSLAALAAGAAGRRRPSLDHDGDGHCPALAESGDCPCRHCRRRRGWDDRLHADAVLALYGADAALKRFLAEHCDDEPGWCDTCLDAHACRFVLSMGIPALESELIPPGSWEAFHAREKRARAEAVRPDLPAADAALVALYDALDALFDLTVGHCASWECRVCEDADGIAYFANHCRDMLWGGCRTGPEVTRRERAFDASTAARLRRCPRECMMPHTAYLNSD